VEVDQDTGTSKLINKTKYRPIEVELLRNDADSIPHDAPELPTDDPDLLNLVLELQKAMEERPIWTRRALTNRVGFSPTLHLLRAALHYVGYQFTGGPFRDCLIRYGLDPRKDKKYRIYQTFFFKTYDDVEKTPGMPWHDVRPPYTFAKKSGEEINSTSHIFDGKNLTLDGKVWMACDITDPLLAQLIRDAPYRPVCETSRDGWFFNGTMAKIKAVMRMKLIAIRVQKQLPLDFFEGPLATPDIVPAKPTSKGIAIPMPGIILTEADIASLREQGVVFTLDSNDLRTTEFKVGARAARLRKKLSQKKESKGKYTLSSKYRRKTKPKPKVLSKGQSNGAAGESNNADTRDTNLDSGIDRALATISRSGSIRLKSTDSVSVAGTPNASGEMDGGSGEGEDVDRLEDLGEDEDREEGDSEEDIEGDSTTESDEDEDGSGTDGEGEGDFDSDPADGVDHTRYFVAKMGYDDPDE
jgi:general transcription factor 3C polypeptide 5 (transcription factor C subunit 1)